MKRAVASLRPDVTVLIGALGRGEKAAHDQLFALVYDELKRVARAHISRSGAALTVNPTALLHEAWIRFARSDAGALEGSAHFYNVLAQAMRQTLLGLADRRHGAPRRRSDPHRADGPHRAVGQTTR
jgi:DNA-directed RNA polymerase specialized sigma24 family protein